MKKYFKPNLPVFVILSGLFIISCRNESSEKQKANPQIPPQEMILQSYFSENHPGKWKDLPENHVPNVTIEKKDNAVTITVEPKFITQPNHYIEFIMLTDYQVREMQKQVFTKSSQRPKAVFVLPKTTAGTFYILLKCNLHDTWYKKIIL